MVILNSKLLTSAFAGVCCITILLNLNSCTKDKSQRDSLLTISIAESFSQAKSINSSDIVSSFEYIKLETSKETLYRDQGNSKVTTLSDSLLFIENFRVMALFHRETGQFIRTISAFGEDPDSYQSSTGLHIVDQSDSIVFARGKKGLIGFSYITGEKIIELDFPKDTINYIQSAISKNIVLSEKVLIAYFSNGNGRQRNLLMSYTPHGEIIHIFPRKLFYENDPNFSFYRPKDVTFYKADKKLFMKEAFNDTVFQITQNTLLPKYRFDLGKFTPSYMDEEKLAKKEFQKERESLMFITNIVETNQKIIFRIHFKGKEYVGFYDKETKATSITKNEPNLNNRFKNDIDFFLPFSPDYLDQSGNLISVIPAEDVYEWFNKNKDKINYLPENLKMLQIISPEDNPVVMIGKLKSN